MATLGIVCGMESEARTLGPVRDHARVIVAITGGQGERVERAARMFLNEGCIRMVSWGIAGGLDPRLPAGEVVIPSSVATISEERFDLDRHVALGREAAETAPQVGVLGLDTPAMTAVEKGALFAASGAAIADMETHHLARIGAAYAVDTLAIRAVADPAGRDLPAYLRDVIDAHGNVRLGRVLAGVARQPGTLATLVRLQREQGRALAALRSVAESAAMARLLA